MKKETNVRETFRRRLSQLRAESGLSQSKLAKQLGISPATIGYYENGDRLPDIDIAARIAVFFDVTADYLLGFSDTQSIDQDMKTACEVTGLSGNAVETLQSFKEDTCVMTVINYLLEGSVAKRVETMLTRINFYCELFARKEIFIETAKKEFEFTPEREELAYRFYWDFDSQLIAWGHDFHEHMKPKEEAGYLLPNFEDFCAFSRNEYYMYCIKESFGIIIDIISEKHVAMRKEEGILRRQYIKAINYFPDIKEKYISRVEDLEKNADEWRKIAIERNGKEGKLPW